MIAGFLAAVAAACLVAGAGLSAYAEGLLSREAPGPAGRSRVQLAGGALLVAGLVLLGVGLARPW